MNCYKHLGKIAVTTCSECGKNLCEMCGSKITPPLCEDCAYNYANSIKSEMVKNIIISVVLMIVGIFVIKSPGGVLLAGIPYGWVLLNKMTPSMFLWLSWIGWIVYFIIKLVLAYVVGVPALAIKIIKWISELKRVNELLKCVNDKEV